MPAVEIVLATRNPKKFRELKALLQGPWVRLPRRNRRAHDARLRPVRWRSLAEYPAVPPVRENGRTFRDNAIKKALETARLTRHMALADDSGLEVDALNGAPGVRSARFAGGHGNDRANNTKLLQLLQGVPRSKRHAQFRCVLALASPEELLAVTEGTLVGHIAAAPRGHRGFGYDPVFVVPRLGKTVAQLPPAVKNRISHRAQAAGRMRRLLGPRLRHHNAGAGCCS